MKLKNGFHGQMSDKFRAAVFIILSADFRMPILIAAAARSLQMRRREISYS